MPIYEYQCKQCNTRHEVIQGFSEAPMTHCPGCGGEVKKLHSSPAIQFKGSGFYKTDYASASSKGGDGKSESKSDSKSESKSESKSDAPKSESKAETKSESSKSETKSESKSSE
jgi:putative FmdB family regulatory protein